jgi:hypothetical protein
MRRAVSILALLLAAPFLPAGEKTESSAAHAACSAPQDTVDPAMLERPTAIVAGVGKVSQKVTAKTPAVQDSRSVATTPRGINDSYSATGNVRISVAAPGVLVNDANPNGVASALRVSAGTTSTHGGNVNLGSDGSFTYNPSPGFEGTDTFTYTLTDGKGNIDTSTVSVAVSGVIWFVNATADAGGDGRFTSPFNALTGAGSFDAAAADDPGDNIFLSSGSYTGGLTLKNNQKLIGQGATASLSSITGITPPRGSDILPSTGGSNPVISANVSNIILGSGNTIRGVTLDVTSPAATAITGSGFGTLTVADASVGGTNGQALNLKTGKLAATFSGISSTNSATSGISLSGVGGSLETSLTTVTNPTGIGLQVADAPTGASLGFGDAAVSGSGDTGVSLSNNAGNVGFGRLDISPDADQRGIEASYDSESDGSITARSGAVSTDGATAVEVARVGGTLPLKVTLTSVAANGGNNGIVLTNTGGSFTVTGDGTNAPNGSGGTIQNMMGGADGTAAGRGISLSNVQNFSLTAVNLHDFSNFAIRGTTVTGFTLNHSVISGAIGNSAGASDEAAISFDNLLGSASILNSNIGRGFEFIVKISNSRGTLNRLTMDGDTFGSVDRALGSDAVQIVARNTAVLKATVTNSVFTQAREDLFNAAAAGASSIDLVFRGNRLSNSHPAVLSTASSVLLFSTSTGAVTYDISCNSMRDADGSALVAAKGASDSGSGGTMTGSIVNNQIGVAGATSSGSKAASGIFVSSLRSGTHTIRIANNTIRQYNEAGIFLRANDGASTLNATITGNLAAEPAALALAGLHAENGSLETDANVTNIVIGDFANARFQNDFTSGGPSNGTDVDLVKLGSARAAMNLSRAGSRSNDTVVVVQDDDVGSPTVNASEVTLVNTRPATPPVVRSCTPPATPKR